MYQSEYYIEKSTNTFADNLAAFGLAFVLNGLVDGRTKITIQDVGYAFQVRSEPAICEACLQSVQFFTGPPILITLDKRSGLKTIKGTDLDVSYFPVADGDVVVDYEAEKENNRKYFDWIKSLPKEDRRKAVTGEISGPTAIHPQWDMFRAINPGALQLYNKLVGQWWQAREAFPDMLSIILLMTATVHNRLDEARTAWKALYKARDWKGLDMVTASQIYNPAQGKGTNSTKAVYKPPGNVKSFWLLEWLKATGLQFGGFTRVIKNSKDRKTYVLMPDNLSWQDHTNVMRDFGRAMVGSNTAIKLDLLASLRYTQALLRHCELTDGFGLGMRIFGKPATDVVTGMQTAFYKSLGNSPATMNISSLNLPLWVKLQKGKPADEFTTALDEHLKIIRLLDEKKGDQYELLRLYRDFVTAMEIDAFFGFTNRYSSYLMSQYERRNYVRPFTTSTLEVLFMNDEDTGMEYQSILTDEGFRNLAYAIRHSTVIPQARKGQGQRPAVEIRYGLGQELARKAAYPEDFLAALSEFVYLYNAENAQLMEKGRKTFRKDLRTSDLESITALVDQFGSRLIANMLIAFGYAREPRKEKSDSESDV